MLFKGQADWHLPSANGYDKNIGNEYLCFRIDRQKWSWFKLLDVSGVIILWQGHCDTDLLSQVLVVSAFNSSFAAATLSVGRVFIDTAPTIPECDKGG